jgi:hypothetical protein
MDWRTATPYRLKADCSASAETNLRPQRTLSRRSSSSAPIGAGPVIFEAGMRER